MTRTKAIVLWLLDRVAQGKNEEVGSMDSDTFNGLRITIMRAGNDEFPVWIGDVLCPVFTLAPGMTERAVRKLVARNI